MRDADGDEDLVTMITMMRGLILKLPYLKEIQISPELGHTNVKALMLAYFRHYRATAGVDFYGAVRVSVRPVVVVRPPVRSS